MASEALLASKLSIFETESSEEPTSIMLGDRSHGIADHDYELSNFYCRHCGERFRYNDQITELIGGERGICSSCGKATINGKENLLVSRSSLWLLDGSTYGEEDNILYHVTTRKDWDQALAEDQSFGVHLGDRDATRYRVNDLFYGESQEGPYYLHRLRLSPASAPVVELTDDLENGWDSLGKPEKVHVYLNQWENPGSLSVYTAAKNVEILGEPEELTFRDAGL